MPPNAPTKSARSALESEASAGLPVLTIAIAASRATRDSVNACFAGCGCSVLRAAPRHTVEANVEQDCTDRGKQNAAVKQRREHLGELAEKALRNQRDHSHAQADG